MSCASCEAPVFTKTHGGFHVHVTLTVCTPSSAHPCQTLRMLLSAPPPGFYQHLEGQTQCGACPIGKHQRFQGEAGCEWCDLGQDAGEGSALCTVCAEAYFRPLASSPAAECVQCIDIPGIICGQNTTIETLRLRVGYWRHSSGTVKTYICRSKNGVDSSSSCRGGSDAGIDGDGYCGDEFHGPMCSLCSPGLYYDAGQCEVCPELAGQIAIAVAILVVVLLGVAAVANVLRGESRGRKQKGLRAWAKKVTRGAAALWSKAKMQSKLKAALYAAMIRVWVVGFKAIRIKSCPTTAAISPSLRLTHGPTPPQHGCCSPVTGDFTSASVQYRPS